MVDQIKDSGSPQVAATSPARILPYCPETIRESAQRLNDGQLVSFPTETVYGLGANALNAEACQKIFTSKGRPLTDPLIVHVHSVEQGLSLIDQSDTEVVRLFKDLTARYWPGPLTLVVKANLDLIPMMITAQTGFVGVRMPNSEIALSLLQQARVPLAAPSANKFGHVSPTKAQHVYKDFHLDTDVLIIDGGECDFGIESTVLKLQASPA